MARGYCKDCGTGLERNGLCPNCDEAAYIVEFQSEYINHEPSEDFKKEVREGYARADKRAHEGRAE